MATTIVQAPPKTPRSLFTSEQSRSEEDNDVSMKSELGSNNINNNKHAHTASIMHRCDDCSHVCEHLCDDDSITTAAMNNTIHTNGHGKANANEWIKLNVGGTCFQTTRTTLCYDRNSFFYRLVQDDNFLNSQKDESGAYMIDRDPTYFVPILNFMRHGKLILNKDISEEGVLEEAEFYNVTQLIKLLKSNTDRLNHNVDTKSHVYRLLHCREDELSLAISTLSDGWKFEQLIPTHPSRSTDYFLIVSREYANKK